MIGLLLPVVVEGAVDRFCRRYADYLLDLRGREEAARWLGERAA